MKNFTYLQPKTLEEAGKLLMSKGMMSIPYAGGTDALGLMKDDIITPDQLVNLKKITNLNKIEFQAGIGLKIGALTTITEIAENDIIKEKYPVLHQAAGEVASPQLRNVGTIGGNLCQRPRCAYFREDFNCIRKGGDICYAYSGENKLHCVIGGDPCYIVHPSDLAVALLALDARIKIHSGKKSRTVAIQEFFILPEQDFMRENILKDGEIITEIQIDEQPPNTKSGYSKMKERAVWDFAVVSVAAVVQKNGNSLLGGRIAFGGVAPIPWQEERINRKLNGLIINEKSIDEVSQMALVDADPLEMNAYKIALTRNMQKRILTKLTG
jgi:xanthine dehydrogenase YagS FAD-binding subunit